MNPEAFLAELAERDPRMVVYVLVGAVAVLLIAAVAVLLRDAASDRLERRVMAAVGDAPTGPDGPAAVPLGLFGRLLQRLGLRLRGGSSFYSEQDLLALETMIAASGLSPARVLPMVLGAKLLFTVLIPALAIVYGVLAGFTFMGILVLAALALPLGLMGPDWILHFVRRPYTAALRRGLPDSLDLLVICTESGMALETALEQVAREIAASNAPMSVALTKLLDELRVLPDRREAFANFGRRAGVEGFRRLATMLAQALNYGTPIAEALRAVAADLRRDRMVAMEGKCAKLPAMLVLPLIVFIMPALFIVLAASPVLRIVDSLKVMAKVVPK